MSRLEQDQEKLMNAAAQVAQNLVSTAAHLSSLKKSPTKLNIKTAIDEVQNTQKLLKNGTTLENIKNSLAKSPLGQSIVKAGGNLESYINLIIKKAQINNATQQNKVQNESKKISKKL